MMSLEFILLSVFVTYDVGARELQTHLQGTQLRIYKPSPGAHCDKHRHNLYIREIEVLDDHHYKVPITHCGQECQSEFQYQHEPEYAIDGYTQTMSKSIQYRDDVCHLDHWVVYDIHAPFNRISEVIIYNRGYEDCNISPTQECTTGDCPCAFLNTEITLEEHGRQKFQHTVQNPHLIYQIKLPLDPYTVAVQEMAQQIALAILAGDSAAAAVTIAEVSKFGEPRAISVAVAIAIAEGQEKVVAEAAAKAIICDGNVTAISEALAQGSGEPDARDEFFHQLERENLSALSDALARVTKGRVKSLAVAHGEGISQIQTVVAVEIKRAIEIGTDAAAVAASRAIAQAAAAALALAGGEVSVMGDGLATANAAALVRVFAEAIAFAVAKAIAISSVDYTFQEVEIVNSFRAVLSKNLEYATAHSELAIGTTRGHVGAYAESFQSAIATTIAEVIIAAFAKLPTSPFDHIPLE